MLKQENYFDNAATTFLSAHALNRMVSAAESGIGNSHSAHEWGQRAHREVENARKTLAAIIGAEYPEQIVFTSGATESNNWIISNFSQGQIGPFEHSSVRVPALEKGFTVLPHSGSEILNRADAGTNSNACPTSLVSIMAVSNEFGGVWRPHDLRTPNAFLHSDLTQALFKTDVSVKGLDGASFSAHKFYGPTGVGFAYLENPALQPILIGGGQERGLRSGTVNTLGIIGMAEAARIARENWQGWAERIWRLREIVKQELHLFTDLAWFEHGDQVPHILSGSLPGVYAESLVIEMSNRGYAISAGSACSSNSGSVNAAILELTGSESLARGAFRISFGTCNTKESTVAMAATLKECFTVLRSLQH